MVFHLSEISSSSESQIFVNECDEVISQLKQVSDLRDSAINAPELYEEVDALFLKATENYNRLIDSK